MVDFVVHSISNKEDVPLDAPIESVSLVKSIVERFRQAIASGAFKPGEQVNESHMAEKLGVSRGTLREAIRILISEGLLEKMPNRSSRVRILSPEKAWEIVTLRAELEGFSARLLAQRLTEEKITRLQGIYQKFEDAARTNDIPSLMYWDFMLHQTIVELSEHELLYDTWLKVSTWIRLMFSMEVYATDELIPTAMKHKVIVDAVISGDPEKAEQTLKKDLLYQPELERSLEKLSTADAG